MRIEKLEKEGSIRFLLISTVISVEINVTYATRLKDYAGMTVVSQWAKKINFYCKGGNHGWIIIMADLSRNSSYSWKGRKYFKSFFVRVVDYFPESCFLTSSSFPFSCKLNWKWL